MDTTTATIKDLTDQLDAYRGDNAWEDVLISHDAVDDDRTDGSDLGMHQAYLVDGSVIDFSDRGFVNEDDLCCGASGCCSRCCGTDEDLYRGSWHDGCTIGRQRETGD